MLTRFSTALLLVAGLLIVPLFGQEADPPNRVARLSYMQGAVSFEPSGENDWSQATLNYPVTTGDRLWTDNGARAEVETGNVALRMAEQTDLTATELGDDLMQFGLAQGSLRIRAYDLRPNHTIEVDTPGGAVTILQSGNYRVDVYPNQNMTLVTVDGGGAQLTGSDLNLTVQSGQAVQLTGSNPANLQWVSIPGEDSFDQWSNERDQRYQRAESRRYVSPEVPGYYDLDGYGSWGDEPQYGPVWYPASVPAGWAPYRFGRWVWVEPWGWTWLDQEPWGFSPFHYGRWVQVGPRWGWLPGPVAVAPVYSPAFVAFVGGAGFAPGSVATWFPLGPGEPFYPWYHHSNAYLRQVNVTNVRNINVTNITNVTNINNVQYRYRTVGATAVSAEAFRNAQPVMRNMVRVNPQQLEHAQVIPHPQLNPTPRAIAAGTAATRPPVPARRPAIVQHPPAAETASNVPAGHPATARPNEAQPRPNETARPDADATRTPPGNARPAPTPPRVSEPAESATRPNLPNASRPSATMNRPPTTPEANRQPLVSKTPPPQERLPYTAKEPAMAEHPGRPLEPQQRSNISQGKPAGPMHDQEFPPHAGPIHSEPAPHPAPSQHSESSQHGSQPKH